MERPANAIPKAMHRLAKATEEDKTNIIRTLQCLQAYESVLTSAFLVAKNDRAAKKKIKNVILD